MAGKAVFHLCFGVIIGGSIAFLAVTRHYKAAISHLNAKTDTVIVYRTKGENRPLYESQRIKTWDFAIPQYIFCTDSVEVVRRDTIPYVVHDTVFFPVMERYYERLDGRLRLWVSGYNPTLERWELDEKESIVTRAYRKKWGLSVTAGPSVIWSPFYGMDVGIGLTGGISYTF